MVLYNEWLTYTATALSWPDLGDSTDNSVRVLFVADPQILSLLSDSEPDFPLSLITIWDADRYVLDYFCVEEITQHSVLPKSWQDLFFSQPIFLK